MKLRGGIACSLTKGNRGERDVWDDSLWCGVGC